MPNSQPVFSVVIPVFNDADGLLACLEGLARQTLGADSFEALVVDNGSDVLPLHVVRKFPFARLLEEASPGSYAARNRGCREARSALLAFTDADCRPAADWLERAWAHFSKRSVSAIGGRIELEHRGRPSAAELYETVFAFRQEKYILEESFAATANMFVRRVVFDEVGAFDAGLKSSGDREWGGRLAAGGYEMVYADDVIVVHPSRDSLRELIRRRRRLQGGFAAVGSRSRKGGNHAPGARNRSGLKLAATLMFTPRRVGIGVVDAMKVICVAGLLEMVGLAELIRLQFGGSEQR